VINGDFAFTGPQKNPSRRGLPATGSQVLDQLRWH
jgi:hypothetical protein